jgi:hypothetical protein
MIPSHRARITELRESVAHGMPGIARKSKIPRREAVMGGDTPEDEGGVNRS